MALDTNIALGVKPVEQPNMLAQMGQMMQMRQMQQGYESENALRDFYAQGGDISTAEGKRQLMSKVGLKGAEIIDRQSQTRSRDVGTAEKSLELYKNQVGFIKTPEDAARGILLMDATPEINDDACNHTNYMDAEEMLKNLFITFLKLNGKMVV